MLSCDALVSCSLYIIADSSSSSGTELSFTAECAAIPLHPKRSLPKRHNSTILDQIVCAYASRSMALSFTSVL